MERDTLIFLKPDFADPAFPGTRFYCWHCALMEGVIASFPELAEKIDVCGSNGLGPEARLSN